jgi:hypothetical protein
MKFSSPNEVFLAFSLKKVGIHARVKVRLPIEKKVISEVPVDKDNHALAALRSRIALPLLTFHGVQPNPDAPPPQARTPGQDTVQLQLSATVAVTCQLGGAAL